MSRLIKEKKKDFLIITIGVIAYLALQAMHFLLNMYPQYTFLNGVVSALQLAICFVMVVRNYKKGFVASAVLMALGILMAAGMIISQHTYSAAAGIANLLIDIFVVYFIAHQLKIHNDQAVTDFLTGLKNRRGLEDILLRKTEAGKPFALAYVDLGNFKFINDTYGHACGDHILRLLSKSIARNLGKNDIITRFGGDEFVILLDDADNAEKHVQEIVNTLCDKSSFMVEGEKITVYLNSFAGIAKFPEDSCTGDELIKFADIAMHCAARDEKKSVVCFDRSMGDSVHRNLEVEQFIREGFDKNYFHMVYQPQFRVDGKRLRGFESLIRMKMPNGQSISPTEFIPIAENSDLIIKIDDYVLRYVMMELKDEVIGTDIVVSVNVSAKNFGNLSFPDKVLDLLMETGYPARNLEIEITEYGLLQSIDTAIENIKKLRNMGVEVALDDFGTGYTSLSYLSKMPINMLKLDKSLIDSIANDKKSSNFVSAIIDMGHLMGCEVISEGVEAESQIEILKNEDCDLIQGYVWSKPLNIEEAKKLVKINKEELEQAV